MRPVIMDTDIGTNVDDVLALLALAGDPAVSLRAVTTVAGDVELRARHALHVLRLLGRDGVPVHTGAATPYSGRPIWPAPDAPGDEAAVRPGAVDALIRIVRSAPGQVTVVAIGPLTNVAAAVVGDPDWAPSLRQLIVMGGDFSSGRAEHNIATDPDAARTVLESDAPALFVGVDVTTTVPFDETDLAAIASVRNPLATLVVQYARLWWNHTGRTSSHPHDALAVLAMLEPGLFEVASDRWRVQPDGVLRTDDRAGTVRHAKAVDTARARRVLHRLWRRALVESSGRTS